MMRGATWTLTFRAHQELERCVAFLRFHIGDADRIVPSLFVRGAARKAKPSDKGGKPEESDSSQELSQVAPVGAPSPGAAVPNVPSAPLKPSKPFG
jgi:hypothetical protein